MAFDADTHTKQMMGAAETIRLLVAELEASGLDKLSIASMLGAAAGALWREALPREVDRRRVVLHAAEVAITGRSQPIL